MLNKKIVFGLLFATVGLSVPVAASTRSCSDHSATDIHVAEEDSSVVYCGWVSIAPVQQPDARDYFGRTELINYVIKKDKEITEIRRSTDVDALAGYYGPLKTLTRGISSEINYMINNGANLDAKDNDGNTALNFCNSSEMYNILRSKGAAFQFDAWVNVYRAELAIAAFVAAGTVFVLNQKDILTADTVSAFAQDMYAACVILAADMKSKADYVWNADQQAQAEIMKAVQASLKNAGKYVLDAMGQTFAGLTGLALIVATIQKVNYQYQYQYC